MNDFESTGKKLKILRKGRKLTQQQLSDALGWSRATVCNYEIGRRNISLPHLKQLAEYFGVGLDYFGVSSKDEVFDLISRAQKIFENESIPADVKQDLFEEIMKLHLKLK